MPTRTRRLLLAVAVTTTLVIAGVTAGSVSAAVTIDPNDDASDLGAAIAAVPSQVTGPNLITQTTLTGGFFANAVASRGAPGDSLADFPTNGDSFAILTSGDPALADDANDEDGSGRDNNGGDSHDGAHLRGDSDYDVSVVRLDVTVPADANCLALDYRFLSEEFPEYVGQEFNDAFIAEVDTTDWDTSASAITAPHDFATDTSGDGVNVNGVGPVAVSPDESAGTTYDAATGLVTTKTPITPGAHQVFLSIFDQGDQILDSAAFVDNLRFINESAATCRPPFVAQTPPPPPPPPGPQPPSNNFTVGSKIKFKNGSTVLTINVPGPGTLSATPATAKAARATAAAKKKKKKPALIKSVKKKVKKAGKVTLTFKPTKAGKKVLKRKHKLSAKMRITFTPTGGTPKSTTKKITIKTKKKHKKH